MRPDPHTRPEYVRAVEELIGRIATSLKDVSRKARPISMYIAGGTALHFYTGERVSQDIDAAFSHRISLPARLDTAYSDADGAPRLLYLDAQYNDTLGLMHEDARKDARALRLRGVDPRILDVRILSPLDLAVSKLSRYSEQDRIDIASLARARLIDEEALQARAEQALSGYVGDLDRLRITIRLATQLVASQAAAR